MIYYIVGGMLITMTIADILWKKIPNLLVLLYITIGVYTLQTDFLFRFLISIFILALFYRVRFFGAGDVKLFALIIGFLGIHAGAIVAIISLFLAAGYSLIYMIFTKQLIYRFLRFYNYCVGVLSTGKIEKYTDFNSESEVLIPMAPYFLTGFILWRCFC